MTTSLHAYSHLRATWHKYFRQVSLVLAMVLGSVVAFAQGAFQWNQTTSSSSSTYLTGTSTRKNMVIYPSNEWSTTTSNGSIVRLYFRRNTATTGTTVLPNFRIRMAQPYAAGVQTFPSTTFPTTGFTEVLPQTNLNIPAGAIGWFSIDLPTPFSFDATKALVVETEYIGTPTNGITVTSTSASPSGTRRLTSAGFATGSTYATATTGTTSGFIPSFGFDLTFNGRDAAVQSLTDISGNMCSANSVVPVTANIRNNGNVALTSVNLNWSVNGVAQTPVNASVSIAIGASADVSLGNVTIPSANPRFVQISATVTGVNGTTDENSSNNTLATRTFKNGLSGTFTVGTGETFTSPAEIFDSLNTKGLCGAVTINIKGATYSGQTRLRVPSANATNTITIQNVTGQTPILEFASNTTAPNWLLNLAGTDYVTIKGITFDRSGGTPTPTKGTALRIDQGSDNLTVDGCTFKGYNFVSGSSDSLAAIFSPTTSNDENTTIKNCTFDKGVTGIVLAATSTKGEGNHVITDNVISVYYKGIDVADNAGSVLIKGNNISRYVQDFGGTTFYGIYIDDCDVPVEVSNNIINHYTGGYGIYWTGSTPATPSLIYNNLISLKGTGTSYGIYLLSSSSNIRIYHNNIRTESSTTSATANSALYLSSIGADIVVKNNIFYSKGTTTALPVFFATTPLTQNWIMSNNALYSDKTTPTYVRGNTTEYTDIGDFEAAYSSQFSSNFPIDPGFVADDNLHVTSVQVYEKGETLGSPYTLDIDGQTRNSPPCLGADEIFPTVRDAEVISANMSLSRVCGSGTMSISATIKNQGVNDITSLSLTYRVATTGVWGAPQVVNLTSLSIPSGASQTFLLNSSVNTVSTGYYQVEVVSGNVNGNTDQNLANNTAYTQTIRPAYSGTVTVNTLQPLSINNFHTVKSAIDSINVRGLCGALSLDISPGTYYGKYVLDQLPGNGVGAPLTIRGIGANNTLTTLQEPGANNALNNYQFLLSNVSYVSFENLTLTRTGDSTQSYARSIWVDANCNNISVDNMRFIAYSCTTATSDGRAAALYVNGAAGPISNVSFTNNTVIAHISAVSVTGTVSNFLTGLTVTNNYWQVSYSGVYAVYVVGATIENNVHRRHLETRSATMYSYYCSDCSGQIVVRKNNLRNINGLCYGYYFPDIAGTAGTPAIIENNFGYHAGTGSNYGLYFATTVNHVRARHNTIANYSDATAYGLYITTSTGSGVEITNNLFANMSATFSGGYPFYVSSATPMTSANNNVIFSAKPGVYAYWTAARADVNALETAAAGKMAGTQNLNPQFISEGAYRITNASINGTADQTLGVTTDIEGNPRTAPTIDPGAYEFEPAVRDASFISLASEQLCFGATNAVEALITNTGLNAITSIDFNWSVNGQAKPLATRTGLNIAPGTTQAVRIGFHTFSAGPYTINASVAGVNGSTDQDPSNNVMPTFNGVASATSGLATPYTLDFENVATGTGVPVFWNISPAPTTTGYRWMVAEGAQGSTSSGPSLDKTTGTATGHYIYTVAANGTAGDVAELVSECISLNGIALPTLKFWYHRYGAGSPAWSVDINVNGAWQNGFYTMTGQDAQQTSATSAWKQVVLPLGNITGVLKIRFRATRLSTTTGESALDNIQLVDGTGFDLSPSAIARANTGCFGVSENFDVTITNLSTVAHNLATNPMRVWVMNQAGTQAYGSIVVTSGNIAPSGTMVVSVPGVNLSNAGTYTLTGKVDLLTGTDQDPTNNLSSATVAITNPGFSAKPIAYNSARFTGSNLATFYPGWQEGSGLSVPTGTTGNWTLSTVFAATGQDTTTRIAFSTTAHDEWFITPYVQVANTTFIRFNVAMTANASINAATSSMVGTDDQVILRITTDCGSSWQNLYTMDGSWVTANSLTNSFKPFRVDLSAYAGQTVRLAFWAYENATVETSNSYDFHLDDIAIMDNDIINYTGAWHGLVSQALTYRYNWSPAFSPQPGLTANLAYNTTTPQVTANTQIGGLTMGPNSVLGVSGNPTISFAGNVSVAGSASITGPFVPVINGTTPQSVGIGLNLELPTLTISNPTTTTLTSNLTVTGTLNLNAGTFNLNNNKLTLKSTASSTARIAPVTGGGQFANAGNFTLQRYLANPNPTLGGWYFLGTGVTGSTMNAWSAVQPYTPSTWTSSGTSQLYYYDAQNTNAGVVDGWVRPSSQGQSLSAGRGVRIYMDNRLFVNRGGLSETKGAPHVGNFDFTSLLTYCPVGCAWTGSAANGWNLVANPYASTIDWDAPSWTKSGAVAGELAIWNPGLSLYATYNGSVGANGGSRYIASGQAFFVKLIGAPTAADLVATENVKVANNVSALRSGSVPMVMRINLADVNNANHEAVVRLVAGATMGYDPAYDAAWREARFTNIYSQPVAGLDLSINAIDLPTATTYVPLVVKSATVGTHTMTFTGLTDVLTSYNVVLEDLTLGTRTNLQEGSVVSFNVATTAAITGRFRLVIMPGSVTSLPSLNRVVGFTAYPNPAHSSDVKLVVNGYEAGAATLTITDVLGRAVAQELINLNDEAEQVVAMKSTLPVGVYTLTLRNAKHTATHKLVVE